MKQIIFCGLCQKVVRFNQSYKVAVRMYKAEGWEHTTETKRGEPIAQRIRICSKCLKKAGYKVRNLTVKNKISNKSGDKGSIKLPSYGED